MRVAFSSIRPRTAGTRRDSRQAGHHRCHRALDQHTEAEREPEEEGGLAAPAGAQIGKRCQGERGGAGQHGVGLGDTALDAQHHGRREEGGTGKGRLTADQPLPAPETGEGCQDGAEHGGDAIGPDLARLGARQGGDAGRLQPVDADRLLVAFLVLEIDFDEVAAFQHLGGRLGKAALVSVERWQGEYPGQGRRGRNRSNDETGAQAPGKFGHSPLRFTPDMRKPSRREPNPVCNGQTLFRKLKPSSHEPDLLRPAGNLRRRSGL